MNITSFMDTVDTTDGCFIQRKRFVCKRRYMDAMGAAKPFLLKNLTRI